MTSFKNSDPHPPIMVGTPPPPEWRIPDAEWDRPPWNRWTFQHIREIMPTANISRGTGPVQDLPTKLRDIDGIEFEAADGSTMTVGQMINDTYTDGLIVNIGGTTVHESYYNGMTPETLHLAQSVSKSVAATVFGILIGQGLINPDAAVTYYLPELATTGWNGAKVQHVLDMASGVAYSEEYTDLTSDIGVTDVASGWRPKPGKADPDFVWPTCIWEQILSLKNTDAEHNTRFAYRSIETDVLAFIMERVTGRRLPQLISDELWSRIGAEHDACITVDSSGYGLAQGGFNATLRDFLRVGLAHLNDGKSNGVQVIPTSWVEDCRNGDHGFFNDAGREMFPNGLYRNQFWVEDADSETLMALGVFGQFIYISPAYDMVIVKLSTWPDFLDSDLKDLTMRGTHAIGCAFQ
jgi:CubicO group peptidase (beta-lactamase class C family)